MNIDPIDKKILNELQFNFPMVERPYEEIGQRVGLSEAETIKRVASLKENKIIRRIGPTFEGSKLGYVNTLVAMKVPEAELDKAGEFVAGYDEVTHDYSRDNEYNIWFTLTCANQSRLEAIISEIKRNGYTNLYSLPALKKFKINARFEL